MDSRNFLGAAKLGPKDNPSLAESSQCFVVIICGFSRSMKAVKKFQDELKSVSAMVSGAIYERKL